MCQGIHTQPWFQQRPTYAQNRQQPTPRRTDNTHTTAYGVPGRIRLVLHRYEGIESTILPTPNPPSTGRLTGATTTLSHE